MAIQYMLIQPDGAILVTGDATGLPGYFSNSLGQGNQPLDGGAGACGLLVPDGGPALPVTIPPLALDSPVMLSITGEQFLVRPQWTAGLRSAFGTIWWTGPAGGGGITQVFLGVIDRSGMWRGLLWGTKNPASNAYSSALRLTVNAAGPPF